MDEIIVSLQNTEFFPLLILCGLLLFVGNKIAGEHPVSIRFGKRAGYLAFVGYCGLAFWHFKPNDSTEIIAIILRALVITGIVVGATWIFMPVVNAVQAAASRSAAARRQRRADRQRRRLERERQDREEERRRVDQERAHRQLTVQDDDGRQRQRAVEEESKRRRIAARAQCDLTFNLCKPAIESRFDKAALDDFMRKYMGDDQPPEFVEKHGQELCAVIERHRQDGSAPAASTIAAVTEWMTAEQARIESLTLDGRMKDELLRHLKIRYMKLAEETLKQARP